VCDGLCADLASRSSPTSVAHFSQHHLLPLLYERAERLGLKVQKDSNFWSQCAAVTSDHGPVLMGHECVSVTSSSKGVIARIAASQVVCPRFWQYFFTGRDSRVEWLLDRIALNFFARTRWACSNSAFV
jgi:hypothetical protein